MSLLDLIGLNRILGNGSPVSPTRKDVNFIGDVTVEDDPVNLRTNVTITGGGGGGGAVSSVFGRTGAVVAAAADYAASLISNDSSVAGSTVKAALETLAGLVAGKATARVTVLDLNLTTDANFTFVDGNNTWHGLTWVGSNIATGSSQFAVVNGTGLVIDCNNVSTDWYVAVNTAPRIQLSCDQLGSDFLVGRSKLYVFWDVDVTGADGNFEQARVAISTIPFVNNATGMWSFALGWDATFKAQTITWIGSTEAARMTANNAHRVFGIGWHPAQVEYLSKARVAAASAPNSSEFVGSAMQFVGVWQPPATAGSGGSTSTGGTLFVSSSDKLAVSLAALTVNTSNTLVATFRRLRIEYEP